MRAGYKHLDTASRYDNEEFVGQAIVPMLFPSVELMDRCLVDSGDNTPVAKVWFTGRDSKGVQRGFCECKTTQCCKWMGVHLAPSRIHLCSVLYLWFLHGHDRPNLEKDVHQKWAPDESAVLEMILALRLTPF